MGEGLRTSDTNGSLFHNSMGGKLGRGGELGVA